MSHFDDERWRKWEIEWDPMFYYRSNLHASIQTLHIRSEGKILPDVQVICLLDPKQILMLLSDRIFCWLDTPILIIFLLMVLSPIPLGK